MTTDIAMRDYILTQLRRRDRGGDGAIGGPELRELVGIGPTDFDTTMAVLVDEGSVKGDADNGYELNAVEGEEQGPGAAATPELSDLDPGDVPAAPAAAGNGAVQGTFATGRPGAPGARELRLTAAMVKALDDETVGKMILAGVDEAQAAGATFVFTVA